MDVTPAVPWLTLVCVVLALVELVGLVLDVRGDLTDRVVVLAHVVRTEQKLAAGVQQHPNVSLRSEERRVGTGGSGGWRPDEKKGGEDGEALAEAPQHMG